jgi:hypothetical protein
MSYRVLRLCHVSMGEKRSFQALIHMETWLSSKLQTYEGYVRNLIQCCGNLHTVECSDD